MRFYFLSPEKAGDICALKQLLKYLHIQLAIGSVQQARVHEGMGIYRADLETFDFSQELWLVFQVCLEASHLEPGLEGNMVACDCRSDLLEGHLFAHFRI